MTDDVTLALAVWNEQRRVGTLSVIQGRWQFIYHQNWPRLDNTFQLSPYFPIQTAPFVDTADDKRVEWFFDNLLPEGGMREALARHANVAEQDSFGLLKRYGEDSAGALSLLPEDAHSPDENAYRRLEYDKLRTMIGRSPQTPLLASNDQLHMSLAGVQNKLGVLFKNDEFWLPEGAAASSHILKPENTNPNFPFCPANEYFCMRLARAVGLPVPKTSLLHIPDALFVIERYDRVPAANDIKRIHQVDLCQMINKWAGYKYESHGGITLNDLFKSLDRVTQPVVARKQALQWLIFNYLIGNNDAHAKNLSFIISGNRITMAPAYDLLCVQTYLPDSIMAMSLQGENKPGWIEKEHWDALAREAGVSRQLLRSYLEQQMDLIDSAAERIITSSDSFLDEEKHFLSDRVLTVINERMNYVRNAFSGKQ